MSAEDGNEAWRRRGARLLALAERWLEARVAEPLAPDAFERHAAFRWSTRGGGQLEAVAEPAAFDLGDLRGVDGAVEALVRNTEQLLHGLPYNHVLLHGERGTGKSSAARGLLTRFAERGLRLVEVRRDELAQLPQILAALRADAGRHRFLVFCDDLSFGADDDAYRALKAALEGSVEAPPRGVCIVATSNRRHLLPESMADNRGAHVDDDNELHFGEALEEKLSLSDRFGLVLGFYAHTQAVYLEIVEHYAQQAGIAMDAHEIRKRAITWAAQRGTRSGRTARQFVDDLTGRTALESLER